MRTQEEKDYWNKAAQDPLVDEKYICDIEDKGFLDEFMQPQGKVLEIGCGVGRLMKPGYCGIDISEGMLEIARERQPECEFKLTDGRTIPYRNETFDTVYCVLVFQHLPFDAVQAYITEARRVLKPDGKFIYQYIKGTEDEPFSKHHNIFPQGFIYKETTGLIHPSWTWVMAHKI